MCVYIFIYIMLPRVKCVCPTWTFTKVNKFLKTSPVFRFPDMKLVIRYIFFEKKKFYGLPHVNLLVERKKSLPSVNLIRGSAGVRRISQSWTWSSCRVVWRLRANPPAIKQPQTTAYVCVCVCEELKQWVTFIRWSPPPSLSSPPSHLAHPSELKGKPQPLPCRSGNSLKRPRPLVWPC